MTYTKPRQSRSKRWE